MNTIPVILLLLFLLLQVWRGWRSGIVRQGLSLLGLCIALAVGYWASDLCAHFFPPSQKFIGGILGFLVGFLVYICMRMMALLFRETHQHDSALVRVFYGLGGALSGLLTAFLFLWIVFFFIPGSRSGEKSTTFEKIFFPSKTQQKATSSPSWGATSTLQQSATSFGKTLFQIGKVTSDPSVFARFLQYPDIQKVLETKSFRELLNTPYFSQAVFHHDVTSILFSPQLYETLRKPEVKEAMKNIELKKALDYAAPMSH